MTARAMRTEPDPCAVMDVTARRARRRDSHCVRDLMPASHNGPRNRQVLVAALVALLCGCAAVDSQASHQQADLKATRSLHGRFSCDPSYVSHNFGLQAPANLATTLGGVECDSAIIDSTAQPTLTVSLERYGMTSVPRVLDVSDGLGITAAGQFSLSKQADCGIDLSSLGRDCDKTSIVLFINTEGDLVAIQTGGVTAGYSLLPTHWYGTRMAIFPRIRP